MLTTAPPCVVFEGETPGSPAKRQYVPLNSHDSQAFETFAPIIVGHYFSHALDPKLLCQSLGIMLLQYPTYSGQVVQLSDRPELYIKPGVHPPAVFAVDVPPEALTSPAAWNQVAKWYPMRPNQVAGNKLFLATMLRTSSPSHGCALLVTVDHVLADATTCACFLDHWSQQHETMFGSLRSPITAEPNLAADCQRQQGDLSIARLHLHPKMLASLKAMISARVGCQVTVNDLLMAMCACAVAPWAKKVGTCARIGMMVDPRGRTKPADYMGNAAVPVDLFVDWPVLTSSDIAAASMAVHRAVAEAVARLSAKSQTPPRGDERQEELLQWNSWARARGFFAADFGAGLRHFEWVNLQNLVESHMFVVVPVSAAGALALQVALPPHMMKYLHQIWTTFTKPQAAA